MLRAICLFTLLVASGAEKLCALGAKGRGFCAAPQLHR
jgi:hypothetical protein